MVEDRGTAPVWVHYRQFYVSDPDLGTDEVPDVSAAANGLIAVQTDGACLVTGLHTGPVEVTVTTHSAEPALLVDPWAEVVEVPFTSTTGTALVASWEDGEVDDLPNLAFAGEGSYRFRVHARGRDQGRAADSLGPDEEPVEYYLIQVWTAPPAPEKVIRQTDQVGADWRSA